MKKIYTYKKQSFKYVKNKIEIDGNEFISIIEMQYYKDEIEEDEDKIFYIDISSIIKLLKVQEYKNYEFESSIYQLSRSCNNIEYVVEDILLDDTLNIFRFGFDESIMLDSDFDDNKIQNDDNGFKSIININKEDTVCVFDYLDNNLIGHDNFKLKLKEKINMFRLMNKIGEAKVLSIFLLGESGIGKSEVARSLQKSLNNDDYLSKINLGNYSSKDALNSLIGSPLGYIGSEEGGELTQKIRKSNTGVLLIDEFEKADEKVFNFFLELLEDGKFTNNKGECIDLDGYIIVFTSNLTEREFLSKVPNELITRFDYICEFNLLSYDEKLNYANKKFDEIILKFKTELQLEINIDKNELINNLNINKYKDIRNIKRAIICEINKNIEV